MKSNNKKCIPTPVPILYYYPEKDVFAVMAAVSRERSCYAVGLVLDEKDVVLFETTDKKEIDKNEYSIYSNVRQATKEDIQKLFFSPDIYATVRTLEENGCSIRRFRLNYINCMKKKFEEGRFIFADYPH